MTSYAVRDDDADYALGQLWNHYGDRNAKNVLKKAIDRFYARMIKDPRLMRFFPGDLTELKTHQYEVFAFITGGPSKYKTLEELVNMLRSVHSRVRIPGTRQGVSNTHYYAAGFHLMGAMFDAGISPRFTDHMVQLWIDLQPYVVTDKSEI